MVTAFIAVLPAGSPADRAALLAAGATAVLTWSEISASTAPDDQPVVVFEPAAGAVLGGEAELRAEVELATQVADLAGVLSGPVPVGAAVATVRPVTDTLKLVDAEGVLAGTADREHHRFVGAPIVARLDVLRALARDLTVDALARDLTVDPTVAVVGPAVPGAGAGPSPVAVLAALSGRGITVLAG